VVGTDQVLIGVTARPLDPASATATLTVSSAVIFTMRDMGGFMPLLISEM